MPGNPLPGSLFIAPLHPGKRTWLQRVLEAVRKRRRRRPLKGWTELGFINAEEACTLSLPDSYERVYYGSAVTGLPPGTFLVDDQPGAHERMWNSLIDSVKKPGEPR